VQLRNFERQSSAAAGMITSKLYKQDKTLINLKTLKKPHAPRYNDSLGDRFAWRLYQRSVAYFLFHFHFLLLLLPVLASLGSLEEIIKCPFDD
jgi:hypothetical protein